MSIFRRISFLGFALVSLVVLAACGGDGDEAFELPPPGEYSFEVTGTMEVQFLEEAVSAGPVTLQETETGEVSGGITIDLGEDGSFTIKDKEGVNLVVGDLEGGPITFTQNEDKPSTGNVGPNGTTMNLNVDATQDSGETATSETPIELEGDGKLGVDPDVTLTTPADAAPVRYIDETTGLLGQPYYTVSLISFLFEELSFTGKPSGEDKELEETDEPAPPDTDLPSDMEEPQVAINDASGDTFDCAGGPSAVVVDLAVDLLFGSVTQLPDGVVVRVSLGVRPLVSAEDESFAVQAQIGQEGRTQVAQFEVHQGVPNSGRLDDAGNVIPGSEGDVTAMGVEVTFTFPGLVLQEGDTVTARSFHQQTAEDKVNCDVTDEFSLDELVEQ